MTLEELQNYFGTNEGYFYRVVKNKTKIEILQDLNTIVTTFENQGFFVRTMEEVFHDDYVRITE